MADNSTGRQSLTLSIEGMSCGHCVAAVRRALSDTAGVEVQAVTVGSASVAVDPGVASAETVVEAVRDAGYEARVA
jgi:copper chaperone